MEKKTASPTDVPPIHTKQIFSHLTAQAARFMTETMALLSNSFCPPSIEAPLSLRLLFFFAVPLLIHPPIGFILNLNDVCPSFA